MEVVATLAGSSPAAPSRKRRRRGDGEECINIRGGPWYKDDQRSKVGRAWTLKERDLRQVDFGRGALGRARDEDGREERSWHRWTKTQDECASTRDNSWRRESNSVSGLKVDLLKKNFCSGRQADGERERERERERQREQKRDAETLRARAGLRNNMSACKSTLH